MTRITLVNDVLKGATSVEVYPSSAMEHFDVTGGNAYIGKDKFAYTGYVGTTLTGCTGISWSHEAGEQVFTYYGVRLRDVIPHVLLMESADPDGVIDAIAEIVDETTIQHIKDQVLDIHKNMDPNRADEDFLELICSNLGLEFGTDRPIAYQRNLARQAANLLKKRGTEAAFRFLVWHVIGYRVFVDYDPQKVIAIMGDAAYRMYTPATPMEPSDKTGSYWKMETVGSGPTFLTNEIDMGPELELSDADMFALTTTSMFPKMTAITVNALYPWAQADGSVHHTANLHGKEQFALLWFMKPDIGAAYPQNLISKGTFIDINRPNSTSLEINVSDGTTTVTETISDCITEGNNHFVAVMVNRPFIYVVINDSVVLMKSTMDIDIIDPGDDWVIGDTTGVAPYEGRFDTFRIENGKIEPLTCIDYWEHIKILMSYGESPDRNSYMLCSTDPKIYVSIANGDGNMEKVATLEHLIEEWLTISEYEVLLTENLPLENYLGMWDGIL